MNKTLKLRAPILVNGKQVKELTYDTNEITGDLFLAACSKSSILGKAQNGSAMMEIDTALHLQLGKAAVIAINPDIDWSDLDQAKGFDLVGLANIGRFFILGRSEDDFEESASDDTSEITPEVSTQAQQKSEKKD